jgi:diacylglycerol O-acyltransferase
LRIISEGTVAGNFPNVSNRYCAWVATQSRKRSSCTWALERISADSLQDWAEFAAPRTFGLAVRAYAGLRLAERHPVVHNLVISNVPGPPLPLYFMGAKIEALYPLGPVFHGAGLNLTVMSNNGEVHVGAIACRESMPDPDALVQHFPKELARLKAAVAEV